MTRLLSWRREPKEPPTPGATEEFGAVLHAMREDLAHDGGSLDPDDIAWQEAFRAAEEAIEREAAAGRYRLHKALDAFAPGWRSEPPRPAHDFAEAMEMAGVIALPAEVVDWGTAEYPVVPV